MYVPSIWNAKVLSSESLTVSYTRLKSGKVEFIDVSVSVTGTEGREDFPYTKERESPMSHVCSIIPEENIGPRTGAQDDNSMSHIKISDVINGNGNVGWNNILLLGPYSCEYNNKFTSGFKERYENGSALLKAV